MGKDFQPKTNGTDYQFLTENNFLIYEDLEKSTAVNGNFNEISTQIKSIENRMTEIGKILKPSYNKLFKTS